MKSMHISSCVSMPNFVVGLSDVSKSHVVDNISPELMRFGGLNVRVNRCSLLPNEMDLLISLNVPSELYRFVHINLPVVCM